MLGLIADAARQSGRRGRSRTVNRPVETRSRAPSAASCFLRYSKSSYAVRQHAGQLQTDQHPFTLAFELAPALVRHRGE